MLLGFVAQEQLSLSGCSLTRREVPPCKRPHLGAAPRRPNAGDVCGPYSSQPYRRVEGEPPCEPQQSAPPAPGGSRDPYEFHEDCDDDAAGPAATAARAALQGTPGQPALLVPKVRRLSFSFGGLLLAGPRKSTCLFTWHISFS